MKVLRFVVAAAIGASLSTAAFASAPAQPPGQMKNMTLARPCAAMLWAIRFSQALWSGRFRAGSHFSLQGRSQPFAFELAVRGFRGLLGILDPI